jgi:hypothetical protein
MHEYEMDWSEFEQRGRARRRKHVRRSRLDVAVTIAGALLSGWLVIAITWGIT